eukprot:6747397-Alexandrium_andersonii.AAC.1
MLHVPDLRGVMNDVRRFGWPLEKVTRMHAELAAGALDVHDKHVRAKEEGPIAPSAPAFTLPEKQPAPQLPAEPAPAVGGEVGAEQPAATAAPADGG